MIEKLYYNSPIIEEGFFVRRITKDSIIKTCGNVNTAQNISDMEQYIGHSVVIFFCRDYHELEDIFAAFIYMVGDIGYSHKKLKNLPGIKIRDGYLLFLKRVLHMQMCFDIESNLENRKIAYVWVEDQKKPSEYKTCFWCCTPNVITIERCEVCKNRLCKNCVSDDGLCPECQIKMQTERNVT